MSIFGSEFLLDASHEISLWMKPRQNKGRRKIRLHLAAVAGVICLSKQEPHSAVHCHRGDFF